MAAEFPGTSVCVDCGGMALCLNCKPSNDWQARAVKAEARVRELEHSLEDAVNGKETAWRAVWEKCVELGLLSFIGGDGTGLGRVLAFIESKAKTAKGRIDCPVCGRINAGVLLIEPQED